MPAISAPDSTDYTLYETLGQIAAFDAVLGADYAFVIYKETNKSNPSEWSVRIKSSQTTGVNFDPAMMITKAREFGAQGKTFFNWGSGIDPSAGDGRKIEYRVHVSDSQPSKIELILATRKADGSADKEQSLVVTWPGFGQDKHIAASISAPDSTDYTLYETLGQISSYDAVLNADYSFVIYKETSKSNPSEWSVRIKSSQTTGVSFDPAMMITKAREFGAQSKTFFNWGSGIDPSAGDGRKIEYRVHVSDSLPSKIELILATRKADGSADKEQNLVVPWPKH